MKSKLSPRFWCVLAIFSLMGQVAWVVENMYFNVFIYKMFHASAADISNMVSASAIAATLTTVFMGALSDRLGKRKLFISAGYILWGISIFSFVFLRTELISAVFPMVTSAAAVGISLTIILDCLMTLFGSTANDAAFNAWLTDSTNEGNRGAAEGINAMMPLMAILVVFGGFMFFDLEKSESWALIFSIIGGLVFLIGILGFFLIKEPPVAPSREPYFKSIFYGFRPATIRSNPALYLTLAGFIIFNISIQIFMPYLIIYYEKTLGLSNYVLIMAPAILIASLVTALWGKVYDGKGFQFSGLLAIGGLAAGYIVLFFFRNTAAVFIGSLLMMSGYLAGMAVFGAKIRDHTPAGKSGLLQGVRIFAQVFIPGILGPYIGRLVLMDAETITNNDGTVSFLPNANIFLAALLVLILILPFFLWIRRATPIDFARLKTPYEQELKNEPIPFAEYPRPQLRRDSYLCLNGQWSLAVKAGDRETPLGEITVPFPPESRISGIERGLKKREKWIYRRSFSLPEGFGGERILLHFGAVDQYAEVFLNEHKIMSHEGGYQPFEAEITGFLKAGENHLRVEVKDPLDPALPYGKQRKKRGGMWYTPISGIWQTVWLESVPYEYIRNIRMENDLSSVTLSIEGGAAKKELLLQTPAGEERISFEGTRVTLRPAEIRLWSPEDPYLYEFTLKCGADCIRSYFALRTIGIEERKGRALLTLNGEPYFFHGLLDQGYFSDGIFLPATADGFREDILRMKECGFNMLRKHIKLEPELFYYECDRLGMIVFQDMINSGRYGFMIDTALPTLFLRRGVTHRANRRRKAAFYQMAEEMIDQLRNHPSVYYYTIFNEGWGQFKADQCYRDLKAMDPSRIFDTTSGWFKEQLSDVESDHIYFKPVRLKAVAGKPMVLSEFGGYSCKVAGHSYNPEHNTGYHFFTDQPEAFEKELIALYEREILPAIDGGLSAAVLTQVSDIEDETNGLLTYDRQICKVTPEKMRILAEKLTERFKKSINIE